MYQGGVMDPRNCMEGNCPITYVKKSEIANFDICEAQGKGRAKGRPRKVTKRSFIDMDGGWWLSFPDALH